MPACTDLVARTRFPNSAPAPLISQKLLHLVWSFGCWWWAQGTAKPHGGDARQQHGPPPVPTSRTRQHLSAEDAEKIKARPWLSAAPRRDLPGDSRIKQESAIKRIRGWRRPG